MRILLFVMTVVILSCGQGSTKEKSSPGDSVKNRPDTVSTASDTIQKTTALEMQIGEILKKKYGNVWQVVNDKQAQWPKDMFDYFIAGKRKLDPDYPYIAKGDFNADGKYDLAALVVNDKKDKYRIAIMADSANIVFWEDDVQGAAITAHPKEDVGGIDGKIIKMKSEGINVEFFEKSSWVLYWNESSFKKIWTGD